MALLRSLGAEHVLNSSDADFAAQLNAAVKTQHATFLLDAIGGAVTQQLSEAAPHGSTILLYSRLSLQDCIIDARTALSKHLHYEGWFLANWLAGKNLIQTLLLSQRAQALLGSDLATKVQLRVPLAQAQEGLDAYVKDMTAGKVLLTC